MSLGAPTCRSLRGLLIAVLGLLVVGSPLLSCGSDERALSLALTANEEVADGEFHELEGDFSKVLTVCGEGVVCSSTACAARIVDQSVVSEGTLAEQPFQRGPPRC
jgi:hypothetical protein